MLLHPLFSAYDVDDSYEPLRRQQQQQAYYNELARRERLRQAEMERERQYRRQLEEERRRRQQEAMLHHLHRQKQAEEHRQSLKEQRATNFRLSTTTELSPNSTNMKEGQSYRIPVKVVYSDHDEEKVVNVAEASAPIRAGRTFEHSIPISTGQRPYFASNQTWSDKKTKRPKREKVSVVVEDASDSENENDDLKSVWRNRRPSPGQWIEPIEFY